MLCLLTPNAMIMRVPIQTVRIVKEFIARGNKSSMGVGGLDNLLLIYTMDVPYATELM